MKNMWKCVRFAHGKHVVLEHLHGVMCDNHVNAHVKTLLDYMCAITCGNMFPTITCVNVQGATSIERGFLQVTRNVLGGKGEHSKFTRSCTSSVMDVWRKEFKVGVRGQSARGKGGVGMGGGVHFVHDKNACVGAYDFLTTDNIVFTFGYDFPFKQKEYI